MELKGKKILFLGDSITEGRGVPSQEDVYAKVLERNTGCTSVLWGISGTRIAKQTGVSEKPRHDLDFLMRVAEMDADADAIVVFGGTNDYGHGDAKMGGFDSRDPYTFYGALHILIYSLLEKYPKAQIVFMTPLHRVGEEIPRLGKPWILDDYIRAIREVTRYYGIPVLDLNAVSGIQPNVPLLRERYCPDGLHPNEAGHVCIAKKLEGFLRTL